MAILIANDQFVGGKLDNCLDHRFVLAGEVIFGSEEDLVSLDLDRLLEGLLLAPLGMRGDGGAVHPEFQGRSFEASLHDLPGAGELWRNDGRDVSEEGK